jgi:type I site-specific deoxyribonuclease, HsdR family
VKVWAIRMKENEIEKRLIEVLSKEHNQWTYRADLKTESDLWNNLRGHINRINKRVLGDILLTDSEFENIKSKFRAETVTPFKASQWLRGENGIASLRIPSEEKRTSKDITLDIFSNKDICGGISSYEVVNQITPEADRTMRGDVTLLINGLPIIHIELKAEYAKDGYMQAFAQIKRYAKEGFFNGIYAATQIFVISNKVATKYFARPTANDEKSFDAMKEFLFNWRTKDNQNVDELFAFTKQALSIPMAHELVSRFTVLVDDKKKQKYLMVLRPYQIHAIKKIQKQAAKHESGFIWHATGSGKTLTSFVATKLLAQTGIGIARTVMVVDRTDLDTQTKDEFSKFASEYHTGQSQDKEKENTLIVGIDNQRQLVKNLLSKENNNTIIVTTIQKVSAAIRVAKESERNKFEKLKGEHIVFIIDECHRAVSDEQMREIKKLLPRSTWFGLTGTPILELNQKQENGTFARTTYQQYGEKLHAYTTKNAMDDNSVLGFQVEYFSTLVADSEERIVHRILEQEKPKKDIDSLLRGMSEIQREAKIPSEAYETDEHIEAMLLKIFKRSNVMTKFRVENGWPTMSGILTTSSIAQAKRIYHKLQKMKEEGRLLNGKFISEKHSVVDKDFPRVAITYSMSNEQEDKGARQDELAEIIANYNIMFGTTYEGTESDKFNRNVNKRLERKESQYQVDGQWLDLVIVVDRLLTGFDAPTVQTLYVDRELKWQKLLQAFSRTNRKLKNKDVGMIVTFRKPETMKENVKNAIKLFSDDDPNWEELNAKSYEEVLQNFEEVYAQYDEAEAACSLNPNDLKARIEQVRIFHKLEKTSRALASYDEFNNAEGNEIPEYERLKPQLETISAKQGVCENLRAEIKEQLDDEEEAEDLLKDIEFTDQRDAYARDRVDTVYIDKLLGDACKGNVEAEKNLRKEIENKPQEIKGIYEKIMEDRATISKHEVVREVIREYVENAIDEKIEKTAEKLKVPTELLRKSYLVYDEEKEEIPHISEITDLMKATWSKAEFESVFEGKYRSMPKVIAAYWESIMKEQILSLKGELS